MKGSFENNLDEMLEKMDKHELSFTKDSGDIVMATINGVNRDCYIFRI